MNSLILLFLMLLPVGSEPAGILDRAIVLFEKGELSSAKGDKTFADGANPGDDQ